MTINTTGQSYLKSCSGALILANHPSYIDVVVLLSLGTQVNCVVKSALWRNPFCWSVVRAAGYIRNDNPELTIEKCVATLNQGESLLIFPEGTRTVPGKPIHFLRGAARISLQAIPTIVPVLIHCSPPTQTKGQPFWEVPGQTVDFRVKILEPLSSQLSVIEENQMGISARNLTSALQNYFNEQLNRYGFA